MVAGYAQQEGMGQDALKSLYSAMRSEGRVVPDAVTFVCLMQACANVGVSALEKGKQGLPSRRAWGRMPFACTVACGTKAWLFPRRFHVCACCKHVQIWVYQR